MIDMDIPTMRERKKERERRSVDCFLKVHEIVIHDKSSIDKEFDDMTKPMLFHPWYRNSYRIRL